MLIGCGDNSMKESKKLTLNRVTRFLTNLRSTTNNNKKIKIKSVVITRRQKWSIRSSSRNEDSYICSPFSQLVLIDETEKHTR